MCPGLTSAGARLLDDCAEGQLVAVMAEGKQHAMAVGQMKANYNNNIFNLFKFLQLSSAAIRSQNAGIAIDNVHFLGDGLWRLETV